jgi:hypothetical protein
MGIGSKAGHRHCRRELAAQDNRAISAHGVNLVKPAVSGEAQTNPTSVKSLIDTTQ